MALCLIFSILNSWTLYLVVHLIKQSKYGNKVKRGRWCFILGSCRFSRSTISVLNCFRRTKVSSLLCC